MGALKFKDLITGQWVYVARGPKGDKGDQGPAGDGAGVTDHGALSGLSDDDHPQYALADGTRGDFVTSVNGQTGDVDLDIVDTTSAQTISGKKTFTGGIQIGNTSTNGTFTSVGGNTQHNGNLNVVNGSLFQGGQQLVSFGTTGLNGASFLDADNLGSWSSANVPSTFAVNNALGSKLNKTGGTITGNLTVDGDIYSNGAKALTSDFLVANSSSNVSNTATGSGVNDLTTIPLTLSTNAGSSLSLSGNEVVIGAGVSRVEISSQAYITNATGSIVCRVSIVSGTTQILRAIQRPGGSYETLSIATKVIDVEEGDKLTLRFNAASTGITCAGGSDTFIYVKVVS